MPYFHVVFTVPAQISALALGNKKLLYGMLLRAAAQTLLAIARDSRHLGAEIGFLAILHTWTQTLLHHPHIHCVVPGGGFSADGARWVPSRKDYFLPVRVLSRLFRGKLLASLDEAAQHGLLRFAGSSAPLQHPRAWTSFLRRMHRKPWVVYAKPPFGSPEQVLKYLARYTHRVAISNRRIVSLTDRHVSFRYRNRKRGNASRTMTLDGAEFLRRFLLHLLPKGFVRIRYFGFMGNRVRRHKIRFARALLGASATSPSCPDRATADADADEHHPTRRCPRCKRGLLVHVALIPKSLPHTTSNPRAPPWAS